MQTLKAYYVFERTVCVLNEAGQHLFQTTKDKLNRRNKYVMYNCQRYKLQWLD